MNLCHSKRINRYYASSLLAMLLISPAAVAQTVKPASNVRAERRIAATNVAFAAFEKGDVLSAIASIDISLDRESNAPHVDLQTARILSSVCYQFKNGGNASRASEVARIAVGKAALPQGRMRTKDAAAALVLSAELNEYVLGDTPRARQLFQEALLIDPHLRSAQNGEQRLSAIENAATAKSAANTFLLQRSATTKR